jgi:hypothetical protein
MEAKSLSQIAEVPHLSAPGFNESNINTATSGAVNPKMCKTYSNLAFHPPKFALPFECKAGQYIAVCSEEQLETLHWSALVRISASASVLVSQGVLSWTEELTTVMGRGHDGGWSYPPSLSPKQLGITPEEGVRRLCWQYLRIAFSSYFPADRVEMVGRECMFLVWLMYGLLELSELAQHKEAHHVARLADCCLADEVCLSVA